MHVYRCFSVTPLTDYNDGPNLDGREREDSVHKCRGSHKSRRGGYFTSRDARLAV